jgi:exopolysaccharide biosynthesis protein
VIKVRHPFLITCLAGATLATMGGRPAEPRNTRSSDAVWTEIHPGLELRSFRLSVPGEGRWTRVLLLHIDPRQYRLRLDAKLSADLTTAVWTVDSAPPNVVAAWNAGQFNGIAPWGWTVMDGVELRPPGVGPLSTAVVADSSGRIRLLPPDSIAPVRGGGGVMTALQAYPTLLTADGEIPAAIRISGLGVDVKHRDARLALGQRADGTLLLMLTRFDGLGDVGSAMPFGLTLAETAALLREQGAVRAVALDGGISSQLLVRDAKGSCKAWRAWRKVPVGVLLEPAR